MPAMQLVPTAFRLPRKMLARMRVFKVRTGVGLSEQVRRALTAWLKGKR